MASENDRVGEPLVRSPRRRDLLKSMGAVAAAGGALSAGVTSMAQATNRPGQRAGCDPKLIHRLIEVMERDIVPLTRDGVRRGNKIFGAALLRKSDLTTILAATNEETENPLWHGEVNAIRKYYEMVNADESKRVDPKEVIFFATHEPCPLCTSAITWGGYDNFYYFFSHEESRDAFQIGHDLKLLKEVFKHEPGGYARENAYWTAYNVVDLVNNCDAAAKAGFDKRLDALRATYAALSEVYQANKDKARNIPLK